MLVETPEVRIVSEGITKITSLNENETALVTTTSRNVELNFRLSYAVYFTHNEL